MSERACPLALFAVIRISSQFVGPGNERFTGTGHSGALVVESDAVRVIVPDPKKPVMPLQSVVANEVEPLRRKYKICSAQARAKLFALFTSAFIDVDFETDINPFDRGTAAMLNTIITMTSSIKVTPCCLNMFMG